MVHNVLSVLPGSFYAGAAMDEHRSGEFQEGFEDCPKAIFKFQKATWIKCRIPDRNMNYLEAILSIIVK